MNNIGRDKFSIAVGVLCFIAFVLLFFMLKQMLGRSGLLGSALMAGAFVLNSRTIYEYITIGHIYVHWVYILTGATLFLVGLQLRSGVRLLRPTDRSFLHRDTQPPDWDSRTICRHSAWD